MQDLSIKHIPSNPRLRGLSRLITDVVYSRVGSKELHLDLLIPWTAERQGFQERYPLIVFIQGSSWTCPDRGYEIPQLSSFARRGFVVATLEHRSIFDAQPFPAFLQDVKCALRFLRANAGKYAIDPERVAVWGTSSGANAAMLMGLTGNWEEYLTDEYAEYSDEVQAVVGCFGPTDIKDIVWQSRHSAGIEPVIQAAFGSAEARWEAAMAKYSPLHLVEPGRKYPPFFLLHGNSDVEVSYHQMLKFYRRLRDCGVEASAVCVDGAGHEWDFWSDEVYGEIYNFIEQSLKK